MKEKVSIILLNWNNYKDTKECIGSLLELNYPNYEVVVVDNGSQDGSTQKIEEEFPGNTYIYNGKNLGFTGGTNVGLKYALENGADFLFFINNDMIADKNFLTPLLDVMKQPGVGIAGPATYCYPEIDKLNTAGRVVNFWKGSTAEVPLPQKAEEVQCLGGCFLIKREVLEKIGGFYEPYFLQFEEIDYCLQARKAGYKVFCNPESRIWHKVRSTLDKMPALSTYYFYRNKLLFMKRNAPFYIRLPFYFYCGAHLLLKASIKFLSGDRIFAASILNSLSDFWLGRFGKKV